MEEEVTCHLINTGASSRSIFFVTAVMHQLLVATLRIRLTEATANCDTVCGRLKTWVKIISKHKVGNSHIYLSNKTALHFL